MTIIVAPVSNASDLRTASDLLCRFFLEEGFATAAATIVGNARRMAGLDELCLMLVARVDGVPSRRRHGIAGFWDRVRLASGDRRSLCHPRSPPKRSCAVTFRCLRHMGARPGCQLARGHGDHAWGRPRSRRLLSAAGIFRRWQANSHQGALSLNPDIVDQPGGAEPDGGQQPHRLTFRFELAKRVGIPCFEIIDAKAGCDEPRPSGRNGSIG